MRRPQPSSFDAILRTVGNLMTPKPYVEGEAAMDALSGGDACVHGHWPHQGPVCPQCVASGIVTVALKLLAS